MKQRLSSLLLALVGVLVFSMPASAAVLRHDVYRISTNKSVVNTSGNERHNGVPIAIWPHSGGKNQQWKVIRKGKHYNIINVDTSLALDLPGNQRAPRVMLQGYQRNSSSAQQYDIIPR